MTSFNPAYNDPALGGEAIAHDDARKLLGQVTGYVALTVGFAALGAFLGGDLSGATGLVLFVATIPVVLGFNIAAGKGREQLAIGLLFGLGLLLAWRSPRSSPTTPTATRPLYGRRPAPRRRLLLPPVRTATPRAETSRRGAARSSGRCWA
jgi:hypothetical protein